MAASVAKNSLRLYPGMPFLNGFCLLIRRAVLEGVGLFDEANFGEGYGEENDYCLRARSAGWTLALADDTYIYHAQSRSYNRERRKNLSDRAGVTLAKLYGQVKIDEGTTYCRTNRVLEGIRSHSRQILPRRGVLLTGSRQFGSKQVLFILPIWVAGVAGIWLSLPHKRCAGWASTLRFTTCALTAVLRKISSRPECSDNIRRN